MQPCSHFTHLSACPPVPSKQIPEDAPAGRYSIKVMLAEDNTVWGCTDAFGVTRPTAQEGAELVVVEAGEPRFEAVEGPGVALLTPGAAFTAKWVYDDGGGEGEGTFEVNLNSCGEDGEDCVDSG